MGSKDIYLYTKIYNQKLTLLQLMVNFEHLRKKIAKAVEDLWFPS